LIIQISVKTVKYWTAKLVEDMFHDMAGPASVPVALHLDHCPEPALARQCLESGWNSVLFDGSGLSYEENFRLTRELVGCARQHGAAVEGELVPVAGVEDDVGSDEEGSLFPVEQEIAFIQGTGIDCYAPAIGTAHGFYKAAPRIRFERVRELAEATGTPMVVHGGTGLADEVFRRLVSLGCAKVNISTHLKKVFADSFRNYLEKKPTEYNPLKLIDAVRADVTAMTRPYFELLGSAGRT
jgi:fructose-bisphosphate aldolase class II